MSWNNPLFWRGLLLSVSAAAIFLSLAWWLYLSPLRTAVNSSGQPSPRLAGWLAALLALAGLQLTTGALWDASMHLQTGDIPGGSDFLWPPHIMIYSSFLFSLVVGLVALAVAARPGWQAGVRDPRRWVRANPYIGAVAVASLYMIMALPGDALWHEIVGIDLTAWSPPHLMIALTNAAVMLSAVAVLAEVRPTLPRPFWANAGILLLLALMLNVAFLVGVLEWELPDGGAHLSRPTWFYPLVSGGLTFFTLLLAKRLVPYRWAATVTAGLFFLVRLSIMAGLAVTGNVVPATPLLFILGALLMDVVGWPNQQRPAWVMALAFTAGFAILALPFLQLQARVPHFGWREAGWAAVSLLVATLLLLPAGRLLAGKMLAQPHQPTTPPLPPQPATQV